MASPESHFRWVANGLEQPIQLLRWSSKSELTDQQATAFSEVQAQLIAIKQRLEALAGEAAEHPVQPEQRILLRHSIPALVQMVDPIARTVTLQYKGGSVLRNLSFERLRQLRDEDS